MTDYRIIVEQTGGPEVLIKEEITPPLPGPGEVRLRHEAIGLNFIDIYHRSGLYPMSLPSGIGSEAAGIIDAVGSDVAHFKVGDRVAYALGPLGAYSTTRTVPAAILAPLADDISSETAAAIMLKGMTAEFLIERCARIQPGQTALVHAAAGGVGSILVQWLKAIGVHVLAHVGNDEKRSAVKSFGIDAIAACPMDSLAEWVRNSTNGRGADVVFDGVGAASWKASLASLAKRGLLISFGNASGPVPPFTALDLLKAGSVFVTRPTLADYCSTPEEIRMSSTRLTEMIRAGKVQVAIGQKFSLSDVAKAHQALVDRRTTGSTILIP